MKTFCTEGPVDLERNYFVSREAVLTKGLCKVDDWRYFTLFAPLQSGKSTYFRFLCETIRRNMPKSKRRQFCPQYLPGIDMKYSLRYYRFVRKIRAEAP